MAPARRGDPQAVSTPRSRSRSTTSPRWSTTWIAPAMRNPGTSGGSSRHADACHHRAPGSDHVPGRVAHVPALACRDTQLLGSRQQQVRCRLGVGHVAGIHDARRHSQVQRRHRRARLGWLAGGRDGPWQVCPGHRQEQRPAHLAMDGERGCAHRTARRHVGRPAPPDGRTAADRAVPRPRVPHACRPRPSAHPARPRSVCTPTSAKATTQVSTRRLTVSTRVPSRSNSSPRGVPQRGRPVGAASGTGWLMPASVSCRRSSTSDDGLAMAWGAPSAAAR